jgi:hypothetical protein
MALVVSDLMKEVRKELEKNFVHGRYMLSGAFRCDGCDASKNDEEDIRERDYGHYVQTRERSKMTAHLPQLWCLVLCSGRSRTSMVIAGEY